MQTRIAWSLGYVLLYLLSVGLVCSTAIAGENVPPLIEAAEKGDSSTVEKLLRDGADPNSRDGDGYTALNWAANNGHLQVVKMLVAYHAAVDPHANPIQQTPLISAAHEGHTDVAVFLILQGADVNAQAGDHWTALMGAAQKGYTETAERLLDHGANIKYATSGPYDSA